METFSVSSTGKASIPKDPNAVLDYTFDWTDWLAAASTPADTITAAEVIVDIGATVQTTVFDTQKVTAWVSGGTPGTTLALRCRVTTAGGRVEDRTVYLKVKER